MPTARHHHAMRVGDWILDPALDTISRDGAIEKLEPRAMRLLVCLAESHGAVVSIERLLAEVWAGVIVGPASVYQAVSQLRKILRDTDPNPTYIATVPRKGYRLVADVRDIESPSPVPAPEPAPSPCVGPGTRPGPGRRATAAIAAISAALVAVVTAASLLLFQRSTISPSPLSIAVLPFTDLTDGKTDQPFCDGLTEELSNWLAQIPSLRVVARTSAFAFRGRETDVRAIGRALDTDHILEGSIRRSGDHMRVVVQLIDARTGYHLWSAAYDRNSSDTIKLQEEISRSVAASLEIRLTPATAKQIISRGNVNPKAYQWYLLARQHQQERTSQSNSDAIELYRKALATDSKFALAYAGLAYALLNDNWLGGRPVTEIATEAEPLLQTALKLNPDLSDAYAARGALRAEQFRIDSALEDLHRAVRLNPSDAMAFREMGRLYLLQKGQPRDALANYTRAAELDPMDSLPQAHRCVALQDLGRFADAAAACARARALQPQNYWPLAVTGWLAAAQGRLDEALKWNSMAIESAPDVYELYNERSMWLVSLGLTAMARQTLEKARTATNDEESVAVALADVAFAEGGARALQAYLSTTRLESSSHSAILLQVAYCKALAGDFAAARTFADRALAAPDYLPAGLVNPWDIARWGYSDALVLALVDMRTGNTQRAERRLVEISATLENLTRNGVRRFGIDEMRASVLALRGDGDGAVSSLALAAEVGWRRSWWAQREPELATIWTRDDFRSLIARVDRDNAQIRDSIEHASH